MERNVARDTRVYTGVCIALSCALVEVGCGGDAKQEASTAQAASDKPAAGNASGSVPATKASAGAVGSQPSAVGSTSAAPARAGAGGRAGTVSTASDAGAPRPADAGAAADAAGSGAAGAAAVSGSKVTFHNGGFWSDAAGARIEAHGGGFLRVDDTWYWIGEDKSGNSAGFKGVNCYASRDLVTWELRGAVLTRATAPELDTVDRIIERPKVSYNVSTGRYVMWLHWEGRNYAEAKAGVFSSENIDGPYKFHAAFQPLGNMSRDDTLFVDDDGTAYFISAANENADLMVYQLTPDYLEIERHVITLWPAQKREAPALFKDSGRYFLVTSGATGWDPNQGKYATSEAIAGPWSELRNLGNGTTFDTQPTYVIPVQGTKTTTYIYAGDRWQDPDLASSKYVWLPLKVQSGQLTLDYYADWTLDLSTGEWSADDGFIPQGEWRLLHVDSEEIEAENGRASNAFDDSASTIWHTAYQRQTQPAARATVRSRRGLRAHRYEVPAASRRCGLRHDR